MIAPMPVTSVSRFLAGANRLAGGPLLVFNLPRFKNMKYPFNKRILHAPVNICGIPETLSKAAKELGYKSEVMESKSDPRNYHADINLGFPKKSRLNGYMTLIQFFIKSLFKYDIYQFHTRASLLPNNMDIPLLKMLGKKIFFYFHGRDIEKKEFKQDVRYIKYINGFFISTPNLFDFVPSTAIWIPQSIDVRQWTKGTGRAESNGSVKILHAITSRQVRERKGSNDIIQAVEILKSDGYDVEMVFLEGVTHAEMRKAYDQADIVVDQIKIGWYGVISVEAMLLQKPVCCYIRDDLKKYLDRCPVINVNSNNLVDRLKGLVENTKMRKELGKQGREYVIRIHDSRAVADLMLKKYSVM